MFQQSDASVESGSLAVAGIVRLRCRRCRLCLLQSKQSVALKLPCGDSALAAPPCHVLVFCSHRCGGPSARLPQARSPLSEPTHLDFQLLPSPILTIAPSTTSPPRLATPHDSRNHGHRTHCPVRARFPEAAAHLLEPQEQEDQVHQGWQGWPKMVQGRRSGFPHAQDRH